jgi:hypothetical protein
MPSQNAINAAKAGSPASRAAWWDRHQRRGGTIVAAQVRRQSRLPEIERGQRRRSVGRGV